MNVCGIPSTLTLIAAESLRILSLARNQIHKIENLESVASTLEQLWLSYNNIQSLAGVEKYLLSCALSQPLT